MAVLAALATFAGAGAAPALAAGPDDGTIVYTVSDGGAFSQISTMLANGSHQRLISSSDFDFAPRWSPDGSRIVFVSTRSGVANIYTMDACGGDLQQLTFD